MAAGGSSFFGLGDRQMQPQGSFPQQNSTAAPGAEAALKKKRNKPGNPNPDSEVVALSPRTLMATNRFTCEACGKGFQREQNLQLHRRGHNLPWKLKQKNPKDVRRRVYLCPEPTCVHHDPSRALGDLTGIKKHYCRKHGEKKWKCDKCSRGYAVESDWKAHTKICGTREYRCECSVVYSRRDTFISHRDFCEYARRAMAQMPPDAAGLYVDSGSESLGLPSAAAQTHGIADQGQSSSSAAASQFDYVMPSPPGSSMLPYATSPSSPSFFLDGGAPPTTQVFFENDGDHSEGGQGPLLHGKEPFYDLMQVQHPEQQQQQQHQPGRSSNANANLLDVGFFSGNGGGSSGSQQDARLVIQDQFNAGGGGRNTPYGNVMAPVGSPQINYYGGGDRGGGSNTQYGNVMAPAGSHQINYGRGNQSQGSHGSLLLDKGKAPLHTLMQLPEQQQQHHPGSSSRNASGYHMFFPGSSGGSSGSQQDARHLISDHQFNGGSGGTGGSSNTGQHPHPGSSTTNAASGNPLFFSGSSGGTSAGSQQDARYPISIPGQFNGSSGGAGSGSSNGDHGYGSVMASIANHFGVGFPSLYGPGPAPSAELLAQNSATALLMKAAQMGSTSSTISHDDAPRALLRAVGFSTGSGQGRAASAEELASHAAHFHELVMNYPTGGIFSDAAGFAGVDDGELSTRDFLGVGRGATTTTTAAPPEFHFGAMDPDHNK